LKFCKNSKDGIVHRKNRISSLTTSGENGDIKRKVEVVMKINLISSVLFVADIAKARKFYEETLQQTVLMDHGPNVGFAGGFAIWQIDHANQMVFGGRDTAREDLNLDAAELYFETEDLEEALKKLESAGTNFIHELMEQPWGQKVIRFRDPDGHILELGEPMDVVIRRYLASGMTPEDVVKRTFMPLEIINQIAASQC
jgi:catechol 2,3-dioxygenase-like lactoylglutathione lyase family enzyme